MDPRLLLAIFLLGAYLLGSISSAVLICWLFRLPDPRLHGSQNPGATNVLRLGGKIPALLTLVMDVLKGFLPVFIATYFFNNPYWLSGVLFFAVMGHLYPIFFGFKGGKGVATALGGFFGLSPLLGGIFVISWLVIFGLFRYSSLAAIIALINVPIGAYFILDKRFVPFLVLLSIIIIVRHRSNIVRLFKGTETKSSFKRSKDH